MIDKFAKRNNCLYCENEMKAAYKNKKFCSNKCRTYWNREVKKETRIPIIRPEIKKNNISKPIKEHGQKSEIVENVLISKKLTHKILVNIAYKWLLNNTLCEVAFKEPLFISTGEIPDVIGFGYDGHSVMIEIKASKGNFSTDKDKSFRKNPEYGMGSQRFYCCPEGLIKQSELPNGWGLIYVNKIFEAVCIYRPYEGDFEEKNKTLFKNTKAEHNLMYNALRKLPVNETFL